MMVNQYLHDLEQGYVLYGLIGQKNNQIDHLEENISQLERRLEPHPPSNSSSRMHTNRSVVFQQCLQQDDQLPVTSRDELIAFLGTFQSIVNKLDINFNFPKPDAVPKLLNYSDILTECQSTCVLLEERIDSLLTLLTDSERSTMLE